MSEYAAYFSTYRITDIEEIDLTLKYLCAMDAKYVALVAERIKSDRAKDR